MINKINDAYQEGYHKGLETYQKHQRENGSFFERIGDLINTDISQIYYEQGGQDGMYGLYGDEMGKLDGLHKGDGIMERIFRNKVKGYEDYPIRIYVLNTRDGGICILGHKSDYRSEIKYTIFHLGEDDGFFFVHDDGSAGVSYMHKISFIDMTSRAISLLNNNK